MTECVHNRWQYSNTFASRVKLSDHARVINRCWLSPLLSIALLCALPFNSHADELKQCFLRPPSSAKPHTWWHWMDGNITIEGIREDLGAMKWVGIGGAQIFDITGGLPSGPVGYNTSQWRKMIRRAALEAWWLGLELCMHNCGGWSSSGGPWVPVEHSMKMLVFTEMRVSGPQPLSKQLPQPRINMGYYKDVAVLAFKTPKIEQSNAMKYSPKLTASVRRFNWRNVVDGDPMTVAYLPPPSPKNPPYIQLEFDQPLSLRCFALMPEIPLNTVGAPGYTFELLASTDGKSFRRLGRYEMRWRPSIINLRRPERGKFFRFAFVAGPARRRIPIAEIYISQSELKASDAIIDPASIRDLTNRMDENGRLIWRVPSGMWTIMRIGQTTIGRMNHPAREGARGLECDKLSKEAVEVFFAGMLQKVVDELGPLAGKSLKYILIDSYEVGPQNWTTKMRDEFRQRRGYDLLPYLPILAGRLVKSMEITERFLWDYRRTIADMFAENYSGHMRTLAQRHGMGLYIEPYGNGNFDAFHYGGVADIPMGEFWVHGGPFETCKLAASIAHTYGKKFVGAEAFTASPRDGGWKNHPYSLKPLGDKAFTVGINRLIFHRFAHQPWLDVKPGMTMGRWGSHIDRTQTWWQMAPAWMTYLARCQYLLQQGHFVADVCYFAGEEAPKSWPRNLMRGMPLPQGYDYDVCSPEVLLNRMSVKDGQLVLPDGMRYHLLVLPNTDRMTPQLVRKVRDLVAAGAIVVGPKPQRSPSLANYPNCDAEVKRLANEVWGPCDGRDVKEHPYGKGKVIWGRSLKEILTSMNLPPDFTYTGGSSATEINYIHRRVGNTDIYFVANRNRWTEEVVCTFRVYGKQPELWHPDTGIIEKPAVYRQVEGGIELPLRFEPAGSVFVVFRKPIAGVKPIVSVRYDSLRATKPAKPPQLIIKRAIYGDLAVGGKRVVDVTNILKRMVRGGRLIVRASNELAGDPAYGIVKSLRVEYVLNGVEYTKVVREGEILRIPDEEGVAPPIYKLTILPNEFVELLAWQSGRYELKDASGHVTALTVQVRASVTIPGSWELHFPPGWGAPERVTFERLISWTEHPNPGIKYFSGTAVYRKTFELPASIMSEKQRVYLDLGVVKYLARVKLNGRDMGVLWKPPFRVDVTDAIRVGRNSLEVHVANLWVNRLIGDEQYPADCRYNPNGAIAEWPKWFLEGRARPEPRRRTFTTWKFYNKDSPLMPSGLLGPVRLLFATRIVIKNQ